MTSNQQQYSSGSTSLATLLTVLFVGLKLTHYIDWSWWWVLSPIWISLGLALAVVAAALVIVCIGALLSK